MKGHGGLWRPAFGLLGLLLAAPVGGQKAPPAPAAQQEQPVLRVTTRLVQVSVIVEDRRGEPIADLTRDDFALLDEGRPQPIRLFSVERNRPLPGALEPLPPNTFSNHLERRAGTPTSLTVILMDGLNTRFQDQAYARMQLIKFLRQLQPQDRVAIYTLGNGLRILHDFTSDAAPLLRAIARHTGSSSPELAASELTEPDTGIEELDQFLRDADQRVSDFYTKNRVERTLQALEAVAQHLSRLPGRKNLIWVSGGFPLQIGFESLESMARNPTAERRTFSDEIERAVRAINDANLAIYPVDARGLIGVFDTDPVFDPSRRGGPRPGRLPDNRARNRIQATHDTMEVLAERTGGRAFYNTNDIQGAIRRALEDSRLTYVLGYYPQHSQWDGRFREVKVTVKRRPEHSGLRVRHRRGYFALPDEPQDNRQRQAALAVAAWSPLEATGLGLTVRLMPGDGRAGNSVKLEIAIPPRDVALELEGDRWVGTVDVLFVQRNAEGAQLSGRRETVSIRVTRESYEQIQQRGMVMTGQLDLLPAAAQLRLVARDVSTGALGSVHIPLSQILPKRGS